MPPLSDLERQRKRREKIRSEGLKPLLVRGNEGFYDERIRLGLAIISLIKKNRIDKNLISEIIKESEDVFDTSIIDKRYINKLITNILEKKEEN